MRQVDTLVAEVLAELKNLAELADNHLLEEKLRGDTHVHVDVEIVVMSNERKLTMVSINSLSQKTLTYSSGTASNGVHHRRLNLNEATLMEDWSRSAQEISH